MVLYTNLISNSIKCPRKLNKNTYFSLIILCKTQTRLSSRTRLCIRYFDVCRRASVDAVYYGGTCVVGFSLLVTEFSVFEFSKKKIVRDNELS